MIHFSFKDCVYSHAHVSCTLNSWCIPGLRPHVCQRASLNPNSELTEVPESPGELKEACQGFCLASPPAFGPLRSVFNLQK